MTKPVSQHTLGTHLGAISQQLTGAGEAPETVFQHILGEVRDKDSISQRTIELKG